MAKIFDILQGGHFDGLDIVTSGSGIEPGLLVKVDSSGSTCTLATAAAVSGIAWGSRYRPYRPTDRAFDSGEPLVIVYGQGMAMASVDFFSAGSLPSIGDTLYSAANGKIATSGSATVKIGVVRDLDNVIEPTGGTGTTTGVAIFKFDII